MKIWYKFLSILLIFSSTYKALEAQLTVKDADQDLQLEKKIQNLRDSLQMVFQEDLNRKVDSLKAQFQEKQDQFLAEFNKRKEVNYKYIQNLEDSIAMLSSKIERYKNRNGLRDSSFERRYYNYIDELLEYTDKKRTSILGLKIGGREINEYKIEVLKNYLNRYYPYGKSAYIQFYLTQVYNNQKDYAKMEYAFLKFIYFYADSPSYSDLKHSLLKLILDNNYFKNRSSDLVKIMDNIAEDEDFQTRYFRFVSKLKNYQNREVQAYFPAEVDAFLVMFEGSDMAAKFVYQLSEYYSKSGKVQYAFLTLNKLITMFPNSPEADTALFDKAEIRADDFNEYNEAMSDYNRFIEENPGSEMTVKAYYKIATIFDNYLQKYDMAFEKYQQVTRNYPQSEYAIRALDRSATIARENLKDSQQAINLYKKLVGQYPDSKIGQQARVKLARLYYDEKQYNEAVDQYFILYRQSPMDKNSIDFILRAAEIYEDNLNNIDKAIETLTYITENFPGTKQAQDAQEKIENLNQQRQE